MRNDDTVGRPFTGHEEVSSESRRKPPDVDRWDTESPNPFPSGDDDPYLSRTKSVAPVVRDEELDTIPISRRGAWQPLSILGAAIIIVLGVILPNPFTALEPDEEETVMVAEPIARHRLFLPTERPTSTAQAVPEHARSAATRSMRVRSSEAH